MILILMLAFRVTRRVPEKHNIKLWPIAMQSRFYLGIAYRSSFSDGAGVLCHILCLRITDAEKLVLAASLFI